MGKLRAKIWDLLHSNTGMDIDEADTFVDQILTLIRESLPAKRKERMGDYWGDGFDACISEIKKSLLQEETKV